MIKQFKKELAELLNRYDASINFTCDSSCDTHGFTGDHLQVEIGNKTYQLSNDWSVEAYDLKED